MSGSRAILRAVFGNTDLMPSPNLFETTACTGLVFVEFHETMTDAIFPEKRIEKRPRA
jgi:hypothetical protein